MSDVPRIRLNEQEYDLIQAHREGRNVTGESTLYGANGEVKLRWEKSSNKPAELQRQADAILAAMKEDIPQEKQVPFSSTQVNDNLLNLYVITDFHLGMLSWGEETGADWDTDLAEDMLVRWFRHAIEHSPASETGVFAQLGDFLHFDGLDAVTPQNKNILDSDTRFQRLIRVVIRAIRRIVMMLLAKHKNVHLIMAEGNHDLAGSAWLRELMRAMYEGEPRIKVDDSADIYYCYEHGLTSLFFHHGHKRKVASLDSVLVAKFRDVFGRTKFSYAHSGHLHFDHKVESNLMTCEQHRTLAASDAYASRGGWMSGRDAKVITYHKQFGEVSRLTISPDML